MLAVPSRDWNVFKQIFAEHWDGFTHAHPRYQTSYYDGLVAKMLGCGNPEKMGSIEYRCLHCGQGKHLRMCVYVGSDINTYPEHSAPSKARRCQPGEGPGPGSLGQAPGTECCVVIGNVGGEAYTGR